MKSCTIIGVLVIVMLIFFPSCKKKNSSTESLAVEKVTAGSSEITLQGPNFNIPVDSSILIQFNVSLDTSTVRKSLVLKRSGNTNVLFGITYLNRNQTVVLTPATVFNPLTNYVLQIGSTLLGASGESFSGTSYSFTTNNRKLTLKSVTLNGLEF